MSNFTPTELEYLKNNRLVRLATIGASGEPHVVPLRYRYNEELDTIDLIGKGMAASKKFRDAGRNSKISVVVDDTEQGPRGIEIRGEAELLLEGGEAIGPNADPEFIRLWPTYIVSWGVETEPHNPNGRRVAPKR